MKLNMLIGQMMINHQRCPLNKIPGVGIGKGKTFIQQHHIPLRPSMPIPCAPHPTSFHRYSSWGWDYTWAHTPSYSRPYCVGYATPREPSCAGQPCVENDRFKPKDRSKIQNKKKVVK